MADVKKPEGSASRSHLESRSSLKSDKRGKKPTIIKSVRIAEPELPVGEIPAEFRLDPKNPPPLPTEPGPFVFLEGTANLLPPNRKQKRKKEGLHEKGLGPLSSRAAGLLEYEGPPINYSMARGNPTGYYGFELTVYNMENKKKKPDHNMNVRDLHKSVCNVGTVVENGALAYTTIVCRNMCLINIDVMQNFVHLRYVYLPHNRLTSLQALTNLTVLTLLEVGHNQIALGTEIPVFDLLNSANYAGNLFENFIGFPVNICVNICFNYNKLTSLEGISSDIFTALTNLELRGNKLINLGPLDIPTLKYFWLAENSLSSFDDLKLLTNLISLHLRSNGFQMMEDFPTTLTKLIYLNLRDNHIDRFTQLRYLSRAPLMCLILIENPVRHSQKYRIETLTSIMSLIRLDKQMFVDPDLDAAILMRKGRIEYFIPPVRDEVVSATPPPSPYDVSDASDQEVILNQLTKAMENIEDMDATPPIYGRVQVQSIRDGIIQKSKDQKSEMKRVEAAKKAEEEGAPVADGVRYKRQAQVGVPPIIVKEQTPVLNLGIDGKPTLVMPGSAPKPKLKDAESQLDQKKTDSKPKK